MRYWFDTEFIDDGKIIDLISIGIVAEDGREYYAHLSDYDYTKASDWVKENVFPHLVGQKPVPRCVVAEEIIEFVGENPEFWAYFASYDWVCLCQLFGKMIDLPKGWPMFPMDLQMLRMLVGGVALLPHTGTQHNALDDARWTRDAWINLDNLIRTRNQ